MDQLTEMFSVPSFWSEQGLMRGPADEAILFTMPELDVESIALENPYASRQPLKTSLELPDVEHFQYGPLSPIELPDASSVSSTIEIDDVRLAADSPEDVWQDAGQVLISRQAPTWEAFYGCEIHESKPIYITEAGTRTFDAALHRQSRTSASLASGPALPQDVFLQSLFALGLGRSSCLFAFTGTDFALRSVLEGVRATGCSSSACDELVKDLYACGSAMHKLASFVEHAYVSPHTFPSRIALANQIHCTLSVIEAELSRVKPAIKSLLQLQQSFERPARILEELLLLALESKRATSTDSLASLMFSRCRHQELDAPWLRNYVFELFCRVSQPWLELADEWLGFQPDHGFSFGSHAIYASFAEFDNTTNAGAGDYRLIAARMPTFMSNEDANTLYQCGLSLRILRKHQPDHPVATLTFSGDVKMAFVADWRHMEVVKNRAYDYEIKLTTAIRNYSSGKLDNHPPTGVEYSSGAPDCHVPWPDENEGLAFADALNAKLDQTPAANVSDSSQLIQLVQNALNYAGVEAEIEDLHMTPPLSLIPTLSFQPVLRTQARLVHAATLRMFFRGHHLKLHLDLQRQYHLFGDGNFVSRLTSALLDSSVATTERELGVMRGGTSLGLRLTDRKNWPPASSELRLALMGVLSDCYSVSQLRTQHGMSDRKKSNNQSTPELPGNLSFAIRELLESETHKIMDPHSLYALDFLRLQYHAPSPLHAVLTPQIMEKYDTVFKFLLRLLRLLFVVSHLCVLMRTKHKQDARDVETPKGRCVTLLSKQAHHFVTTCAYHFFTNVISDTWSRFSSRVDSITTALAKEDAAIDQGAETAFGTKAQEGIEDIREQHEACLDQILSGLLLRRRQTKVMGVLEGCFSIILRFAKFVDGDEIIQTEKEEEQTVRKLQADFSSTAIIFLDVCRGLQGKGGKVGDHVASGIHADKDGESVIQRLVLCLEGSGSGFRMFE